MRRMFREVREVREIRKSEKSAFENLQEGSELLKSHGVFTPDPDTKPGGRMWNLAKLELGYSRPDEELDGFDYALIVKKIRDIKKAEKKDVLFGIGKKSDEEIKEILEARKPEMPKLREVEKDLSNEGVLKAETKVQAQAKQQSYDEKYRAAMQAAQELASSGFYTLEDAIRIVMANL